MPAYPPMRSTTGISTTIVIVARNASRSDSVIGTSRAGVGVGTLYRHFPQRADLIVAVMKSQIDACADAAASFAGEYPPDEALARWMQRYVDFILTKRGDRKSTRLNSSHRT